MKAVVVTRYGDAASFAIDDLPSEEPGAGEVRVRVRAAAVNFVDILVAAGRYQIKPALPFVSGGEFAGVVDMVGQGVEDLHPGDRVCGSGLCGAHGQMIVVKRTALAVMPTTMGFAEGATFRVGNLTAYNALVRCGAMRPGEYVVVLGAAGGVGRAAVQIAKALGGFVVASASTPEKRLQATAAGADVVIDSNDPDWRKSLKAAVAGRSIDIVVDPVGGQASEPAFRSLGWGGRHLVVGFAAGHVPSLPTNLALVKGIRLIGVNIREYNIRHPLESGADMAALNRLWRQGKLKAAPIRLYRLDQFAQAMREAADRQVSERIVIEMPE